MKQKNPAQDADEAALAEKRPRVLMEDAVTGAVAGKTVARQIAGALDESLLGSVLARRPRGLGDALAVSRIVSMPAKSFALQS